MEPCALLKSTHMVVVIITGFVSSNRRLRFDILSTTSAKRKTIKMSEELGAQIQNMFKGIYDAADLKYLRPIKRQMFKCGHDCLDDKNTVKQAENCIDECGRNLHKAMNIVQKEVNSFQGRIDRCLMDCQDNVRNEKDETKAKRAFDGCAEACVKKFVLVVPEVVKSVCDGLSKI